ncbi:MAG TPA: HD domain-containing protein [Mobilitalea sp.]|nr:HD domain-containing protein [Mobilitalea sp.]
MEAIRIRTDQAVSGMIVAADVYTSNDQLIITKGTRLDERMITKLRFYNISGLSVYKRDPIEINYKEESYLEKLRNTPEFKKFNSTYVETISEIESNFHKMAKGESEVDIDSLLKETDRVLNEGRSGIHIFEMLHGIRDYDDMTFVHSLNVSLICNVFAGWLKMSKEETKIVTLAGLFHDIGKMLVLREIIAKAGKLQKTNMKK